jgi:acylphosphatase
MCKDTHRKSSLKGHLSGVILLLTVLSCCLLSFILFAAEQLPSGKKLPIILAMKLAGASPEIDGNLSHGEWPDTSSFCGYRNWPYGGAAQNDITTYLGYSSSALYFLYVIPLESDEPLISVAKERDGRVWNDDSIEVFLQPDEGWPLFHLIINSEGVVYDRRDTDVKWNGNWEIGNYIGQPPAELAGIYPEDVKRIWLLEIGIPFSELGRETPVEGETWRVNFCRNSKSGGRQSLTFAPTFTQYAERENFGYLEFGGDAGAVLSLTGLGMLPHGSLKLQGRLRNNSQQSVEVLIKGRAESPSKELEGLTKELAKGQERIEGTVVETEKTFNLKPMEITNFNLSEELTDKEINLLKIDVVKNPGKPDKKVLYQNNLSLNLLDPLNITVENYPSYKKLKLLLDTKTFGDREALQCLLSVYDSDKKRVFAKKIAIDDILMLTTIDYKNWSVGDYILEGILFNEKGDKKASTMREFSILEEPEWLDKTLGVSDKVLKPWTPLEYEKGNIVSMWGRQVRWGNNLFPESIISNGHEMLAAPIKGYINIKGKEYEIKPDRFEFIERKDNRGAMQVSGKIGTEMSFHSDIWIEYDGLIWFTIRLISPVKQKISSLSIDIPLQTESAKYLGYGRTAEAIKEGEQKFSFVPIFLIGSEDRGICFAAETAQNWEMAWGKSAFTIQKESDKTVFSINLISRECDFAGEKTYSFGLQPMPVKPLPPDWHSWNATVYRETSNSWWEKYAKNLDAVVIWAYKVGNRRRPYMHGVSGPAIALPMTASDNLGKIVDEIHQDGDTPAVPYILMGYTDNDEVVDPVLNKQRKAYFAEWRTRPYSQGPWGVKGTPSICLNSSYQDYLLYAIKRMIDKYKIDGVYFDGCGPSTCQNYNHGCGWQSEDGGWFSTTTILATRNFLKRLATLLEEATEKDPTIPECAQFRQPWPNYFIWGHSSSTAVPPVHSFVTIRFDGEQFQSVNTGMASYKDLLNLDYFRAEFLSTQTGILTYFLPFGDKIETFSIFSYLLAHGVGFYPEYVEPELTRKIWDAQTEFGTRQARFIPSWQDGQPVEPEMKKGNILVACWIKEGKILSVVSNIGKEAERVNLLLNGTVKQQKDIPVYDVINNKEIEMKNGKLSIDVPANAFRMLAIGRCP